MEIALWLIALGLGFKIYSDASMLTKKRLKRLGKFVGAGIMIVSFSLTVYTLAAAIKYGVYGYCPIPGATGGAQYGKAAWQKFCPFGIKQPNPPTP